MRKFLVFTVLLFCVSTIFAQEKNEKPIPLTQLFFENGVVFMNNDLIKSNYITNSFYNWGIGFRVGYPNRSKILPFFQFSRSQHSTYTIKEIGGQPVKADSTFTMSQLYIGTYIPLLKNQDGSKMIHVKTAYIYGNIFDKFISQKGITHGVQFGIGYEQKIWRNSRIYINYTYDLQKMQNRFFKDYDLQRLALGIML